MFAFLARYNSALLIFPIFLYILINREKVNIKSFIIGIGISFLAIVPVFVFYFEKFGNIIYPFINFESTSTESSASAVSVAYNSNIFFFLQNFPAFVGAQGITILINPGFSNSCIFVYLNFKKKSG